MKLYRDTFISAASARIELEIFIKLTEVHSPEYGPLHSTLQTFENNDFLSLPRLNTSASTSPSLANIQVWAQDYLDVLKARIGMKDWNVLCIARDSLKYKRPEDKEFFSKTHLVCLRPYYTDSFGRPVIYFDQNRISESGYMASHMSESLSHLMLMKSYGDHRLSAYNSSTVLKCIPAFLGLGLSPLIRPNIDQEDMETQIFSCAIYLMVKGHSIGKLTAHNGGSFPDNFEKKIKSAFAQLHHNKDKVDQIRAILMLNETEQIAS